MVKPGGTGRPRLAISARLAPLPPSRSRMLALPSALPSPKVNTHLPDFVASAAGFVTAGFAGLLVNALRAPGGGAGFRAGADGFDFVAAFLVFEAALAMALKIVPREGKNRILVARLTPRFAGSTQAAEPLDHAPRGAAISARPTRSNR